MVRKFFKNDVTDDVTKSVTSHHVRFLPRLCSMFFLFGLKNTDLSYFSTVLVAAGDPRDSRKIKTEMSGIGEPYFAEDPVGVKNVSAQLGLTTYLHCKVNNLNGKTVRLHQIHSPEYLSV